jgi:hypothetical protein
MIGLYTVGWVEDRSTRADKGSKRVPSRESSTDITANRKRPSLVECRRGVRATPVRRKHGEKHQPYGLIDLDTALSGSTTPPK